MTTTTAQNMIFPLESENQFQEAVKMTAIQAESQTLTIESTASNVETASSYLKKRKAAAQVTQIDTSAPTASLIDIVSDPKLAYSSTKTRKIRKTEADSETPTTAVTSTGAKKLVLKDGKIEFEGTVAAETPRAQESEAQKRVTSASFRTSKNAEKWTEEETDKFYEGLEIFGSDFSMVGILFPKRTRDQIKKKFTREEKNNGKRVNEALKLNVSKRSIPGKLMETLNISTSTAFQAGQTAAVDEISKVLAQIVKGNL